LDYAVVFRAMLDIACYRCCIALGKEYPVSYRHFGAQGIILQTAHFTSFEYQYSSLIYPEMNWRFSVESFLVKLDPVR